MTALPLFVLPRAALEVARFAGDDAARPNLLQVCVHADGPGVGVIVATNGHYLARMRFKADIPAGRWLIPAAILLEAAKVKNPEAIDIYADRIDVRFGGLQSTSYQTRVELGGAFPPYEQVIPLATAYGGKAANVRVGMDFEYVADIATCLKNLRKLAKYRGISQASIRFTSVEPELSPIRFEAGQALCSAVGIESLDFVLMPVRL